jgi:hypothetical protein
VAHLLERWFPPEETVVPSPELSRSVVERCREAQVEGGAVYDAPVGLTAAEASLTLLTRDDRAARTYRRIGVAFDLVH